jgi:hypothetical protein
MLLPVCLLLEQISTAVDFDTYHERRMFKVNPGLDVQ